MATIKLWKEAEPAPSGKKEDEFEPYLETFLLDGSAPLRGVVLVLPGGGYCNRAPHEGAPVAERFNALGFHALVLQYRVAPYRYPAPQRDVLRAVRIIRSRAAEWGIDPEQVAVLGFSAGGHLCASAGTLFKEVDADAGDEIDAFPARPNALIPCYPVINLTKSFGHRGSGWNLLGEKLDEPEADRFDLENRVTQETPPTFLWHTATDQCVNVENSIRFAQALWKNGVKAELHIFPEGAHGLGLAPESRDVSQWPELAAVFLENSCGFTARK